jgi:regulator of PEP synthase PpsR (kinase-PPPase family)
MTEEIQAKRPFVLHLVSDATGTTIQGLARACLAQFDNIAPEHKIWPMIRTQEQLMRVLDRISAAPGPVLFTIIDETLRRTLQKHCHDLGVPAMAVLDPVLKGFSSYLGLTPHGIPGLQHAMDDAYLDRMEAVDFALSYDDGRNLDGIEEADVILVGVSRTSKTPTCFFLAKQGIRAANIPLVPLVPFREEIAQHEHPLFVGLLQTPQHLVHLRRSRLQADGVRELDGNAYLDLDAVTEEIRTARRLFSKFGWPVIDVSRRSIEETAAEIQSLLQALREKRKEGAA